MMKTQLSKKDLYESVKTLVELEDVPHIHLHQHKLFTLFSIAFQYMLFRSTKFPGAYILRIEDSSLADKLTKKSKDPSTRKFLQALLLPRKMKYQNSVFYLDFFHIGSWKLTNDIPRNKIQGALIIKNSSQKPMNDLLSNEELYFSQNTEQEDTFTMTNLPHDYYLRSLIDVVPKTITIAFDEALENCEKVSFSFIKEKEERPASGVHISKNIDLSKLK